MNTNNFNPELWSHILNSLVTIPDLRFFFQKISKNNLEKDRPITQLFEKIKI